MKPHKQVLIPQDRTGWEPKPKYLLWESRCPECGEIGVEQMGRGGDHEAVTLHPDRDAYDSPIDTRGGYVKVELFCPSGHGFDLIIANHKGSEFIGIVPAGERNYGDLWQTETEAATTLASRGLETTATPSAARRRLSHGWSSC